MKIQIYNSEIEFIIVSNKTLCVIKNLPADFCNPLNKGHNFQPRLESFFVWLPDSESQETREGDYLIHCCVPNTGPQ